MSGDKVRENDLIVKSYFCNVCSKVYAYKHTFQRHYYSIHGNNNGFKCIHCYKSCDEKAYEDLHEKGMIFLYETFKCYLFSFFFST